MASIHQRARPRLCQTLGIEHNPWYPDRLFWDRFLIDAAIFSLGSWLILFAPGTLRLIHRTRHGPCLHCAYDLKNLAVGSKCPECGRL